MYLLLYHFTPSKYSHKNTTIHKIPETMSEFRLAIVFGESKKPSHSIVLILPLGSMLGNFSR